MTYLGGTASGKTHMMVPAPMYELTGRGKPYLTKTACGIYMGGKAGIIQLGDINDVDCGRCQRAAHYVVAKREAGDDE